MESRKEEREIYQFFKWSVMLKGAISLAEVIAGCVVFFIPPTVIVMFGTFFLQFIPIPALQNALMGEVSAYTTGAVTFLALYLLSRGLINVGMIWGLLHNKMWSYPLSLGILSLFVLYQLVQIVKDSSVIIVGITIFDLIVMYFIYREWRIVLRHQGTNIA